MLEISYKTYGFAMLNLGVGSEFLASAVYFTSTKQISILMEAIHRVFNRITLVWANFHKSYKKQFFSQVSLSKNGIYIDQVFGTLYYAKKHKK